jgi:PiT family inorganic phosphate transporter
MALCALFMALGTLMGGRRIIDTVGREMVSPGPREGLAADLGNIACLLGATLLGLPVSTTHTRTCALLGAGSAGGARPDRAVAGRIALAWVLTFPGCMAIGYWMAKWFLRA